METMISLAAVATSLLSALAFYGGSTHCRWRGVGRLRVASGWLGLAVAGFSLWLWVLSLGGGAGLCAMLGTLMLAMMALPYLAALTAAAPVTDRRAE